jgi:hypothetical protein
MNLKKRIIIIEARTFTNQNPENPYTKAQEIINIINLLVIIK